MANNATQSIELVDKIKLRVMVDKESKKVLYAEAVKDFVDVLLSFLTLPLGTIARLVANESNIEAVKFGSISSLYQSVSDLDKRYLSNQTCKKMLLQPRNSMEAYCQKFKLNIDDTEPLQHFVCQNWECSRKESGNCLSIFRDQKCSCGKVMDRVLSPPPECEKIKDGFAKETSTFIICDDLSMIANDFGTVVHLLHKLEVTNVSAIAEQTVDISNKEVLDILKLSLVSKTPLTDFVFKKKHLCYEFDKLNQLKIKDVEEKFKEGSRQMSVKVLQRKSTREILFIEGGIDFIDFVLSFLTFPLGGVLHMLQGFSSVCCIDNFYQSMTELSLERCLRSQELKGVLTDPPIAAQFELINQILPISVASLPIFYCHSYINVTKNCLTLTGTYKHCGYDRERCVRLNFIDPKHSVSKSSSFGEFAKGPSIYMVTDDLVVTPMSFFTAISHLNSLNVPLSDVEERVVRIGLNEGLGILKASLFSTSALTHGLNQFINP